MPKQIEVPGQGIVEFPDSMSDDQIVAAIQKISPALSPAQPQSANPRMDKILAYARETDRILGLTPGTSERQLNQESRFRNEATSPVGAMGIAQVMPKTLVGIEKRVGRKLDPRNEDDALLIHREVMRENMAQFKNEDDALRAYNAGWDRNRWNNPETNDYIRKIKGGLPNKEGYVPFAPVRKNIDIKSLDTDADWINASLVLYNLWEKKPFQGDNPKEAAAWGKDFMWWFDSNIVNMGMKARDVIVNGTPEEQAAMLYMMDTLDEVNVSMEGIGRRIAPTVTDPFNVVSVGSLGLGFFGRQAAKAAEKEAIKFALKTALKQALGRTGAAAGIDAAITGGTQNVVQQNIAVSAGRQENIDLSRVGMAVATSAAAGVVLGTGGDVGVQAASPYAKKAAEAIKGLFGQKAVETGTKEIAEATAGLGSNAEGRAANPAGATNVGNMGRVPGVADEVTPPGVANATAPDGSMAPGAARGATLTPEEIAQATARQQSGRLPADEMAPGVTPGPRVDVPEINTGLRTTRVAGEETAKMTQEQLDGMANQIVEQLRPLSGDDMKAALEQLRTGTYSLEQQRVISRALKIHADEIRVDLAESIKAREAMLKSGSADPEQFVALEARIADLEARLSDPSMADDAFGSMAGSILQDRQKGLPGVEGLTPEKIAQERNIPIEEARQVWSELVSKAAMDAEIQKVAAKYDADAAKAIDMGDLEGAARITSQKWKELDARVDAIAPGSASFVQKLTELAISNVFSLKTVLVNLIPSGIKTLVIPAMKFLNSNPLEKAARAELVASYAAMRSSFSGAMRAAWAGYKYEQALLTRDGMRLVEGELALTGKLGGAVRFFPRILNASDEFLSRINYDSFVAGRAAAEAVMEGQGKGLTGKQLDAMVKEAVEKAVSGSRSAEKGDELVMPIINKGINLGLTGDDLFKYVEREAVKNPEALLKGTDEEALNFVRDVLYKRDFSGQGMASKAAQKYEDFTRNFPSWRLLVGQLFFRTPVRVFEEGIRLTPGLQFIAPNFIDDLKGVNGTLRQVRARSEAMTSLAITGAVISLYAQGRITGDGAYDDYKQTKTRLDSAKPEPYTIRLSDGSTWNFKGFDPIATPMKIIVNALERIDQLRIREAQGEFLGENAYKKPVAAITIATASVAQAIRDASLVEGLDNTIKFMESFADPEQSEDKFVKLLGDKLFLLVPNTLHKIAKDNDPTIKDPKTFWQMVEDKLLKPVGLEGTGIKTSKAYDLLGNPRRMSDTGSLWNVFSTATVEERMKGLNPDQQYVLAEMDRLSRVTGVTFAVRTKHPTLGDLDLRTQLTSDGKGTLYDRWQEIYRSLEPEKVLKPILQAPMPEGTYRDHEGKTAVVQQQITQLQNAAFDILLKQEDRLINRMIDEELRKARAKAGMFDTPRP